MKIRKLKYRRIILNLSVIGLLSALFCCKKTEYKIKEDSAFIKKNENYIPYYLEVFRADSLYMSGDYQESYEILDSLFKEFEPLNHFQGELETYVRLSYLNGNFTVLKPSIKKLVDTWGYSESLLEHDSLMTEIWYKANISEQEMEEWEQEYKDKINWTLRDTLLLMKMNDQLYRGKDWDKEIKREDSVDLSHKDLLKYIFNKYGYPDYRLVGNPRFDQRVDIGVIFLHISDKLSQEEFEYFRENLLNYAKQGLTNPMNIAMLVDPKMFNEKNKTVYGTYGTNESFGDRQVLFDTVEVNRNRKAIGLPSIQYGIFTQDYIKKMSNL